eukprot:m.84033 g.84033  ORF g.84033 m.84033 type:complete len:298 (-) comp9577_c0_seq1:1039-1932(-)
MGQCLSTELDLGDRQVIVKRKLGEGAFSDVLLVSDAVTNEKLAMKVIRCMEGHDFDTAEREAKLYGLFNHENLVRCVAWSRGSAAVRMLFPLADNGTVQDMIDRCNGNRGIPDGDVISIFRGSCCGIHAMHTHHPPFAHRDIKPANILLYGNRPVLTDFGSATSADLTVATRKEALALQEYAAEFSTLPFRSPELFEVQAGWDEHNTLQAADVWALGTTLYTMCCGETPFERAAGPQGSLTLAIAQGKVTMPPAVGTALVLVDMIRQCLKVDPQERISMDNLLAAADKAQTLEVAGI